MIKQDKAELRKQKLTVTSGTVVRTNVTFGMCDCTVVSYVGMGNFSLILGILHICGHTHVRLHVSPGMDSMGYAKLFLQWGQVARLHMPSLISTDCYTTRNTPKPGW